MANTREIVEKMVLENETELNVQDIVHDSEEQTKMLMSGQQINVTAMSVVVDDDGVVHLNMPEGVEYKPTMFNIESVAPLKDGHSIFKRDDIVTAVLAYTKNIERTIKEQAESNPNITKSLCVKIHISVLETLKTYSWYNRYLLTFNPNYDERYNYAKDRFSEYSIINIDALYDEAVQSFSDHFGTDNSDPDFPLTAGTVASVVAKTEDEYMAIINLLGVAYSEHKAKVNASAYGDIVVENSNATIKENDSKLQLEYLNYKIGLMNIGSEMYSGASLLLLESEEFINELSRKFYNNSKHSAILGIRAILDNVYKNDNNYQAVKSKDIHRLDFINFKDLVYSPLSARMSEIYKHSREHKIVSDKVASMYVNFSFALLEEDFDINKSVFKDIKYDEELTTDIVKTYKISSSLAEYLHKQDELTEKDYSNYATAQDNLDKSIGAFHTDLVDQNGETRIHNVYNDYEFRKEEALVKDLNETYGTSETPTFKAMQDGRMNKTMNVVIDNSLSDKMNKYISVTNKDSRYNYYNDTEEAAIEFHRATTIKEPIEKDEDTAITRDANMLYGTRQDPNICNRLRYHHTNIEMSGRNTPMGIMGILSDTEYIFTDDKTPDRLVQYIKSLRLPDIAVAVAVLFQSKFDRYEIYEALHNLYIKTYSLPEDYRDVPTV